VCTAWDFKYFTNVEDAIDYDGPCLVEIRCSVQQRYPRLSNVMKPDGTFDNRPIEDMFPFLDRNLFKANMHVALIE
jgi:acetolactate synthase-1/2/3 large subunit